MHRLHTSMCRLAQVHWTWTGTLLPVDCYDFMMMQSVYLIFRVFSYLPLDIPSDILPLVLTLIYHWFVTSSFYFAIFMPHKSWAFLSTNILGNNLWLFQINHFKASIIIRMWYRYLIVKMTKLPLCMFKSFMQNIPWVLYCKYGQSHQHKTLEMSLLMRTSQKCH